MDLSSEWKKEHMTPEHVDLLERMSRIPVVVLCKDENKELQVYSPDLEWHLCLHRNPDTGEQSYSAITSEPLTSGTLIDFVQSLDEAGIVELTNQGALSLLRMKTFDNPKNEHINLLDCRMASRTYSPSPGQLVMSPKEKHGLLSIPLKSINPKALDAYLKKEGLGPIKDFKAKKSSYFDFGVDPN